MHSPMSIVMTCPDLGMSPLGADWAAITYTDAQIGKVLTSLEQNGFQDDTVIALWGDQ